MKFWKKIDVAYSRILSHHYRYWGKSRNTSLITVVSISSHCLIVLRSTLIKDAHFQTSHRMNSNLKLNYTAQFALQPCWYFYAYQDVEVSASLFSYLVSRKSFSSYITDVIKPMDRQTDRHVHLDIKVPKKKSFIRNQEPTLIINMLSCMLFRK